MIPVRPAKGPLVIVALQIVAALAVVFGIAVLLTGRSDGMAEELPDAADTGLPRTRRMVADDVADLKFALVFRGYRMNEVDEALDYVAADIAARDAELEELRNAVEDVQRAAAGLEGRVVPAERRAEEAESRVAELERQLAEETARADQATRRADDAERSLAAARRFTPTTPTPSTTPTPPVATPAAPPVPPPAPATRPVEEGGPAYDPWSVKPQSRYAQPPEWVEVDDEPDHAPEDLTAHQSGYAPMEPDPHRNPDPDRTPDGE